MKSSLLTLDALLLFGPLAGQAANLNPIPWPKSVETLLGSVSLNPRRQIVAADAQLHPPAEVLAKEIFLATGRQLDHHGAASRCRGHFHGWLDLDGSSGHEPQPATDYV